MLMKNPFCCIKNITIEHFIVYLFYVYGKYTIHDIMIKKIILLNASPRPQSEVKTKKLTLVYPCYTSNKNNNNPHQNLTEGSVRKVRNQIY